MAQVIFDACSLIYLNKIQLKEKLPLLGEIYNSPAVKEEIIVDIDKFLNAKTLKSNVDKKIIKIKEIDIKHIPLINNIGKGENETIEICSIEGAVPVTDDHHALNYVLARGLKPKTSEVILLDFLKKDIITFKEFNSFLDKLAVIKSLKLNIISFFQEETEKIKNKNK